MRRLPVYFLIDVSESMVGEPIKQVEDGMRTIISELRTDPYALETVHVSIIAFAGKATELTPLEELTRFYPPRFPIGGGTSLGAGLTKLMDSIDANVVKGTATKKGDWKPLIFLFTDGTPTDKYEAALKRWQTDYARRCTLIAVTIGRHVSTAVLSKLTPHVMRLTDTGPAAFSRFFKWISASISTGSERVADNGPQDGLNLPEPPRGVEVGPHDVTMAADENFAVMLAKCSNTRRPYLLKFGRRLGNMEDMEAVLSDNFHLIGAYPIEEEAYQKLSDPHAKARAIRSGRLFGAPVCPCCGNSCGLVVCGNCGRTLCSDAGPVTCPWCNANLVPSEGSSEGEQGFDIDRTIG